MRNRTVSGLRRQQNHPRLLVRTFRPRRCSVALPTFDMVGSPHHRRPHHCETSVAFDEEPGNDGLTRFTPGTPLGLGRAALAGSTHRAYLREDRRKPLLPQAADTGGSANGQHLLRSYRTAYMPHPNAEVNKILQ